VSTQKYPRDAFVEDLRAVARKTEEEAEILAELRPPATGGRQRIRLFRTPNARFTSLLDAGINGAAVSVSGILARPRAAPICTASSAPAPRPERA
jgi:hypothetical protein